MSECDSDAFNRQTVVETCNMFYCNKSKCDHVKCRQARESWNATNVETKSDGTLKTNKKCTSSSLYSVLQSGIAGGHWKPTKCPSKRKIAIIIPFRDREKHLCVLLKNLIPMLVVQQSEFRIFVAEQVQKHIYLFSCVECAMTCLIKIYLNNFIVGWKRYI
jgi:hypothetical protein